MARKGLIQGGELRHTGRDYDVYREMGSGFLAAVYQECLAVEFRRRQIPFEAQTNLSLTYRGEALQQMYRADFVCFSAIVVELKAVKDLAPEHKAQMLNYLKATGLHLGLLANFGHHPKAQLARIVL